MVISVFGMTYPPYLLLARSSDSVRACGGCFRFGKQTTGSWVRLCDIISVGKGFDVRFRYSIQNVCKASK